LYLHARQKPLLDNAVFRIGERTVGIDMGRDIIDHLVGNHCRQPDPVLWIGQVVIALATGLEWLSRTVDHEVVIEHEFAPIIEF
jgi:hypothetical protein